uniref:Uncharacterized protein n=1 Tax=Arundo donax TaxID=35708 RepID=A0A0A9D3K5_ARUDO
MLIALLSVRSESSISSRDVKVATLPFFIQEVYIYAICKLLEVTRLAVPKEMLLHIMLHGQRQ